MRGLPYHACCNRTWNQWGAPNTSRLIFFCDLFVLTYNYRNLNLDTPEEWKNLNPNARHHRSWWRKWTKVSCCNYFLTGILFSFMILFILYSYNFSTVYNFITPAQQLIFAILFVLTNYYRNLRLSYNFSIVHLAIFLRTQKCPPHSPIKFTSFKVHFAKNSPLGMIFDKLWSLPNFFLFMLLTNNYRNLRLSYNFSIVPVCFVYC